MGVSQSRQEDVPFEFFDCACLQGTNACYGSKSLPEQEGCANSQMRHSQSETELNARYKLQFTNANFDLDVHHPTSPPYLGTSYWEVKPAEPANLLNISQTEPHDSELLDTNVVINTPPQTPKRTITTAANTQPSLFKNLNLQMSAFSTPRLTRAESNTSNSTIRTATTTSTVNSSSIEVINASIESKRGIEVTFTPRRLFNDLKEESEEEEDDDEHFTFLNPNNSCSQLYHPLSNLNFEARTEKEQTSGNDEQEFQQESNQEQPPFTSSPCSLHEGQAPPETPHSIRAMNTSSRPMYCGDTACDMNAVLCDRPDIGHDENDQNGPPSSPCCLDSPTSRGTCQSDDKSIILRNGVLVKAVSPTASRRIPDGVERGDQFHVNTLPSHKPIHLKITESYAGYSSNLERGGPNEGGGHDGDQGDGADGEGGVNVSNVSLLSDVQQTDFFSYDPYFSLGEYTISTPTGQDYGNGLCLKMGEQYMSLMDRDGRVWCVTRSRHTFLPSAVIYSPKPKYPGQIPSSHRPSSCDVFWGDGVGADAVELYPWALVKKDGRGMEHDVRIHLVAEPGMQSGEELVGGLFSKKPTFRCRHGLDEKNAHSHTIVYRINDSGTQIMGQSVSAEGREIPCCMMLRDPIHRDLVDVTIAPGIDPLLIICYLAVHFKMVSEVTSHGPLVKKVLNV